MLKRFENNPIIKKEDIIPSKKNYEVIGVFNAGVCYYNDQFVLLLRIAEKVKDKKNFKGVPIFDVETKKSTIKYFDVNDTSLDFSDSRWIKDSEKNYLTSISHFRIAYSNDGYHFDIQQKPWLKPNNYYESYGIEDPRITQIGEVYYINYTGVSPSGTTTRLISTKDFKHIKKYGNIFLPDNKDCTIFPEKINQTYYVLNRPTSQAFNIPEMWISKSKNLKAYYDHEFFAGLRKDKFDSARIGGGAVPFKTPKGWIEIYHGSDENNQYCLGVMLLDLNNPSKIIARSDEPFMVPNEKYEKEGFVPNVIFTCGLVLKNDCIYLYYGAADEVMAVATFTLNDIYNHLGL